MFLVVGKLVTFFTHSKAVPTSRLFENSKIGVQTSPFILEFPPENTMPGIRLAGGKQRPQQQNRRGTNNTGMCRFDVPIGSQRGMQEDLRHVLREFARYAVSRTSLLVPLGQLLSKGLTLSNVLGPWFN